MVNYYIKTVILYCLQQINGERSIYSVFHLLNGKKSSQTIQDAHLFQMTRFFKSYQWLSREEFEKIIVEIHNDQLVIEKANQHFLLTNEGKALLQDQLNKNNIPPFLDGWNYHLLAGVFWERFSLLVQVCSNLINHNSAYLPIQQKYETQYWLKSFLQQSFTKREELAKRLYDEMINCFESENAPNPTGLVIRLTGYNRIGLTPMQASSYLKQEFTYYHLQFLNSLHYMIKMIQLQSNQYPLLHSIITDVTTPFSFTISTEKTYELLKNNFSLDKIVEIRKLKRNTIEDHIVEIALIDKAFDISPFVDPEKQKLILLAANKAGSKQLRQIRNLTSGVDYFEIRLVLAKYGEQK